MFTVKIYTTDEKFTERFDVHLDAFQRAINIMDVGEYVKSTRRGDNIIHDVYKTTLSGGGKVLAVNTGVAADEDKMRFDGKAVEEGIKAKDDERIAMSHVLAGLG